MNLPFKSGFKITQVFGANKPYYSQWGFEGHEGIDLIPLDNDFNMYSIEDGVVLRDVDNVRDNYGIYCVIWNPEKQRAWWYCHMANNVLNIGQSVKAGQLIGKMGATGNCTGAHLHLGLRYSNETGNAINTDNGFKGFVNPLPVLEALMKGDFMNEDIPTEVEDQLGLKDISRYNKYWTGIELGADWVKLVEELEGMTEDRNKWKRNYFDLETIHLAYKKSTDELTKKLYNDVLDRDGTIETLRKFIADGKPPTSVYTARELILGLIDKLFKGGD